MEQDTRSLHRPGAQRLLTGHSLVRALGGNITGGGRRHEEGTRKQGPERTCPSPMSEQLGLSQQPEDPRHKDHEDHEDKRLPSCPLVPTLFLPACLSLSSPRKSHAARLGCDAWTFLMGPSFPLYHDSFALAISATASSHMTCNLKAHPRQTTLTPTQTCSRKPK